MDMTIYTSGSVEFLEIMLNSTAMITGSGTTEDLAKIGALIGLLVLGFQAVFNNQPIGFQKPAILIVLYALFYGPTTTVVIQDTVSNQARVVDNIPLGPAAIGSILSTVSYEIARTSEQANAAPGMTEYGLFNSLYTLTAMRSVLSNPAALDSYNNFRSAAGVSLPKSFRQHMINCVGNPTELENNTIESRKRASNAAAGSFLGAIATDRHSQYTYIWNGELGNEPKAVTCPESYNFLVRSFNEAVPAMMDEVLAKGFASEFKQNRILSGAQLHASVNEAIQSLAVTNKSAQEYAITSVLISEFEKGRADAIEDWHGARAAVALRDALNQQELQWAGRGDVFKHYMRPMIAFFEGLLYGITPFIAFAMLLGGAGISILGKYLILPLTVGMWMPLLSIVNAFTLWYAGAQVEPILNGYDPTSTGFAIQQMQELDAAIGKALGVGGLLAASVPALALFIVSGSAYVANSVMSSITSGEKFRSEDIVPRVQESAPALATTAMYTSDQTTTGASLTGSREKSVTFKAQEAAEASVRSASAFQEESMSTLQDTAVASTLSAMSTREGMQHISNLGGQLSSSLDLSSSSDFRTAYSTLRQAGFSEEQIKAGMFEIGLSGSLIAAGALKDSEQYRQMSSSQQQEADQAMQTLSNIIQERSTDTTTLNLAEQFASGVTTDMGVTNADQFTSALSTAQKSSETYEEAQANKSALAQSQDLDLKQFASNAINHGSLANGIGSDDAVRLAEERFFKTPEERGRLAHHLNRVQHSEITLDQNEQKMAAAALALQESGRLGELVNSEFNPFMISPGTGNATRNEYMREEGEDLANRTVGLEDRFTDRYNSNAQTIGGTAADIVSRHGGLEEKGRSRIKDEVEANRGTVQGQADGGFDYLKDKEKPQEVDLNVLDSPQPIADHTTNSVLSANASLKGLASSARDAMSSVKQWVGLEEPPQPQDPLAQHTYTNPETGETWVAPEHMRNSDVPYMLPWEEEKGAAEAERQRLAEEARPKQPQLPMAPSRGGGTAGSATPPPILDTATISSATGIPSPERAAPAAAEPQGNPASTMDQPTMAPVSVAPSAEQQVATPVPATEQAGLVASSTVVAGGVTPNTQPEPQAETLTPAPAPAVDQSMVASAGTGQQEALQSPAPAPAVDQTLVASAGSTAEQPQGPAPTTEQTGLVASSTVVAGGVAPNTQPEPQGETLTPAPALDQSMVASANAGGTAEQPQGPAPTTEQTGLVASSTVVAGGVAPNTQPEPQAETLTPAPAVDQSMVASAGTGQQEALQSPAPAIDQTLVANAGSTGEQPQGPVPTTEQAGLVASSTVVAGGVAPNTQPEPQGETLTPAPALDQSMVASANAGGTAEQPQGPVPTTEQAGLVASSTVVAGGVAPNTQPEPQAETLTPAPAVDQSMVASAGTGQQEALQSPAPAIDQTLVANAGSTAEQPQGPAPTTEQTGLVASSTVVAGGVAPNTQPEPQGETLTPAPALDQSMVASANAGGTAEQPQGPVPTTEQAGLVASSTVVAGGVAPNTQPEPQAETLTPAPAVDQSMVASAGTGQQEALQSPAPAIDQTLVANAGSTAEQPQGPAPTTEQTGLVASSTVVAGGVAPNTQPEPQGETLTPAPALDQSMVASANAGGTAEQPQGPVPTTEQAGLVASSTVVAGGVAPNTQPEPQAETLTPAPAVDQSMVASAGTGQQEALQSPATAIDQTLVASAGGTAEQPQGPMPTLERPDIAASVVPAAPKSDLEQQPGASAISQVEQPLVASSNTPLPETPQPAPTMFSDTGNRPAKAAPMNVDLSTSVAEVSDVPIRRPSLSSGPEPAGRQSGTSAARPGGALGGAPKINA